MHLSRYILGFIFLWLVSMQATVSERGKFQKGKAISRKLKETDSSPSVTETGDLTEEEKELEKEILEGQDKTVKNKKTKKARKAKKAKKAWRKKKAKKEHLKKKESRDKNRVKQRKAFLEKAENKECFDKLDLTPGVSTKNCADLKKLGLCKLMVERMKMMCMKTCDLCPAPAPPIIRKCESSKYGCCWDNSHAKGPEEEGCPPCVNKYDHMCQQFRKKCFDLTGSGNWMRENCPAKCRVCTPKEDSEENINERKRKKLKKKMREEKEKQQKLKALKRLGIPMKKGRVKVKTTKSVPQQRQDGEKTQKMQKIKELTRTVSNEEVEESKNVESTEMPTQILRKE